MFKDDSHGDYERILSGSLSRTVDFVKFAEAKNAALLTFASAWALAITSILATNRQLANAEIGALALSRVLFVLTVLVAALSFLPKLRPESFHRNPDKPKNLLFYGDIALFEFETFKTRLPAAYLIDGNLLAGERYLDDTANALVLFHALRLFREPTNDVHRAVLSSIDAWLADPNTHAQDNARLRWEALAALSQTESTKVVDLVQKFRDRTWTASQARFRNGDVAGGLQICLDVDPGVVAPWRDRQIEHAKIRFGAKLRMVIDTLLRKTDLELHARIGALRLAGYLADPQLGEAIETSWNADSEKNDHLEDYLWAAAQCCGNNPDRFLGPVCDAWAALSDKPKNEHSSSPRDDLAAHSIRWAFHKDVPISAIPYFVKRGQTEELRWPITFMLHGLDHPDAVEFVARELAAVERQLEGTKSFSPFTNMAPDEWRRRQEEKGRPMSREARDRLLAFWQNESTDKHLREQSFRLWAASEMDDDLEILRSVDSADLLADKVLWEQLRRKDRTAIGGLIIKLQGKHRASWWQLADLVWSDELNRALDQELERRRASVAGENGRPSAPERQPNPRRRQKGSMLIRYGYELTFNCSPP